AVTNENELCVGAATHGIGEPLDEQQVPLLCGEAPHADEGARCGIDRARLLEELGADGAVNDADLVPVLGGGPAPELCGAIIADGDHECGGGYLAAERETQGRIELVGPVNG